MGTSGERIFRPQFLTPQELTDSLSALAMLINLKLLDRYWTSAAQRPAAERRESLTPVVDEMIRVLRALGDVAPRVAATSVRHATEMQTPFEVFLRGRPRVRELVERDTGLDIAKSAEHVSGLLVSRLEAEAESLREENSRIERGRASAGDLSAEIDACLDVMGVHLEAHLQVPVVAALIALL